MISQITELHGRRRPEHIPCHNLSDLCESHYKNGNIIFSSKFYGLVCRLRGKEIIVAKINSATK